MDYEKILKGVVDIINTTEKSDIGFANICSYIGENCPEFKESDDEKIREWLIGYFRQYKIDGMEVVYANSLKVDDILSWLRKQSTQTPHKYNTGDWIISKYGGIYQVKEVMKGSYNLLSTKNTEDINSINIVDNSSRLLTVSDIQILEKQDEPIDKGEISDGYHTFNELYYYRMLYNAAFFNLLPKEWVHKSKRHHDGEECFGGGWFIVMAQLPTGQISNHYELKDWDLFDIPEKEFADEWDGHSPQLAAERLHRYLLEKQNDYKFCGIAESRPAKGTLKELVDNIKKPKFNIGDWIANDYCAGKIIELTDDAYLLDSGQGIPFSCEHNAHLWTINDARDGDILAASIHHWEIGGNIEEFPVRVPTIFIYRETKTDNKNIHAYVSLFDNTTLDIYKSMYYKDDFGIKDVHPATKEQKELILNKIQESGWSWNPETKELNRLKDK